ncbi:conserved hypothetical protein [Methanothrix thermoacetophila PT]|uniref:MtN3 and saliva related transmembrane protein n=2 Tax=Methanotrichaceae TaxID=143067 RepID=A0B5L9_METTP|nr:conserved hypothetical protein [Methanothrix thermoacetophila PT]
MFGFYPQIIKMYRTKLVGDLSLPMLLQYTTGIFLWLLYGIYLENTILIVSNAVSLASFLCGIILYLKYNAGHRVLSNR